MHIHIVGNKGIVGLATEKALILANEHRITGSDINEEILTADILFICTPERVVPNIIESSYSGPTVIRSTIRPDSILEFRKKYPARHFCTNPEFLKAHTAFWDCYFPKGILIGECCKEHGQMVENIWKFTQAPIYHTSPEEASLIKILSNVHAAMLITFWNYMKPLCDQLKLNVNNISRILPILDERVSKYGTIAGSAYGGTCLPKDMKQLIDLCKDLDITTDFLDSIENINSQYTELGISRGGL